jgi:hypothetical protein
MPGHADLRFTADMRLRADVLERTFLPGLDDLRRDDHMRQRYVRQQRDMPGSGDMQRLRDVQLVGDL